MKAALSPFMTVQRLFISAMWLNFLAFSATAETTILRPGPCSAQTVYLLADNSGALIEIEDPNFAEEGVIVFRQRGISGWASQRILRRFDLKIDEQGGRIVNSGAFCEDRRAG